MTALWVVLLRHSVVIHVRLIVCRCRCRCHTIITVNATNTFWRYIHRSFNQSINQSVSQSVTTRLKTTKIRGHQSNHAKGTREKWTIQVMYTLFTPCPDARMRVVWTCERRLCFLSMSSITTNARVSGNVRSIAIRVSVCLSICSLVHMS